MGGNIFRRKVRCSKNCRCAKSDKWKHTAYILRYFDANGNRHDEHVPKPKLKALRQRIRRYKAKDMARKRLYLHLVRELPRIVQKLEKDPFDDDAWKSLNQLITEVPDSVAVTIHQKLAVAKSLLNLTNAIQPYLDFISAELALLEELHYDILDNVRLLRKRGYEPTLDTSVFTWSKIN